MGDLYTTISLTGTVATLLNRDAMLSASVSAGTTVLPIGDSYMDRGNSTIVVFPDGGTLSVGTESLTVVGTPPSTTSITVTPSLSNSYPIYTPVLRTDYFDVATNYGTPSTPGTIRVGMEEVSYSTIDVGTTRVRFYIDSRGTNAYPHTEWAPVTDAAYTPNNPATDSEIGRWGVIEAVDYHHGALDQNTLDLHALDKLMDATRPEFGRVEMTGMDVWQDAYYANKKDIAYYVDAPTSFATVRFEVYTTTGTDSASKVYIGDTIQKTWWDVRFATGDYTPDVSIAYSTRTQVGADEEYPYALCTYNGDVYLGADVDARIFKYTSGAWEIATAFPAYNRIISLIVHAGKLIGLTRYYVLVEYENGIGTELTTFPEEVVGIVSYGTKVYGIGSTSYGPNAYSGNIYSWDGTTRSVELTANFGIGALAVYNDQLYAFGNSMSGYTITATSYVFDGTTWTPTPFDIYYISVALEYDGNLYALSEWGNESGCYNGTSWTLPFASLISDDIEFHCATVCSGLLIIGGSNDETDESVIYTWDGTALELVYATTTQDEYTSIAANDNLLFAGYDGDEFVDVFTIVPPVNTLKMQNYYLATFGTQSATVWLKIKDPATGGATLSMFYGSPMAIDYTLPATPIGFSVATLGSWSATSTGTFDIGDRGFATVREGDPVNVVELDGATRDYRVSGMIYDQRAGTLTMEIGKPYEGAIADLVKPFRTRDIISTKNL